MERKVLVNDMFSSSAKYNAREIMSDFNKEHVKTSEIKTGPKGGKYIIVTEKDSKGNSISKKVYLPKQ